MLDGNTLALSAVRDRIYSLKSELQRMEVLDYVTDYPLVYAAGKAVLQNMITWYNDNCKSGEEIE